MQPSRINSGGRGQNVVDQMLWWIYFHQFFEPVLADFRFRQQRPADGASFCVRLERGSFWAGKDLVQGIAEQRVELAAVHIVMVFGCHHITCLYVRCSRRASSARPRFIRDLTVPSGTFSTVAISL